ncbi:hypothetical protein B0H13DRAFT_2360112 [Mycena leptocephala]|nr:hypothetical protein B0H13DRAFT_2360112 [Mycena leptocephala]
MPVTQHQAAGIEPPKPLAKRERKPKRDPRTFKEIAADLTTAQDTRNHTVDAPAQVAVLNAPEINTTNKSPPAIPDAAPAIIQGPMLRPWERMVEVVIERPKPRPLNKTGADTARKAGEDTDTRNDPFSLFGHRARYAKPQERAEVHEQLPDTLYDEEHTRGPEYDFEDRTAIQYVEEDEDEERFGGYCPSSPPIRRRHSAEPRSRSHSADSVETEHQRPHLVDSPMRRALLAGSPAPAHSLTSPCGQSVEGGSRSRSPLAGPSHYQARSHSADPHSPSPSERSQRTPGTQVDAEFTPTHGCTRSRCSPLPASSPPPVFESDFDDGEDDYGKQEEEREKKRLKALTRGGRFSPSLEDEEEFEAEVAQNGIDDEEMLAKRTTKSASKSKSKKSAADPKSKRKGKQHEVTETSGSAAGPSKSAKGKRKTATASGTSNTVTSAPHPADSAADSNSNSDDGDYAKKPGQISEETRECLFELESQFKGDILGVQQKSTRATSAWNVFQLWYSQVKGNPGHLQGAAYSAAVKAAFLAACGPDAKWGKDTLDIANIPWLDEWQKGIAAQAVINFRKGNKLKRKLQKELEPVLGIGKMLLENYGVHMIGSIVDIDGQASLYFGVGDDYKEFRDRHKMVLGQQMKNMEHEFGVMDRRKRALEAHDQPPLIEFTGNLAGRDKEKIRDMHQRAFARIMGGMLQRHQKAIGAIPDDVDAQQYKMKWGVKFLDEAFNAKCHIINYPPSLEDDNFIISSTRFDVKKIKTETFKKFLPGLVKSARVDKRDNGDDDGKDEDDEIVVWDEDELALPLEDQQDIPLVISVGGAALRCVKHSPVYDKALQKEREKTKRAAEKKAKKAEKTERKRRRSSSRPACAESQNDANTHDDRGRPEQSSRKDANSYSNQRDLDNYRDSKRSRRQPPSPGPQPSPHDADRRVRDNYRGSKLSRRHSSSSRRSLSPRSPQRSRHDVNAYDNHRGCDNNRDSRYRSPSPRANRQPNHHHDSKLGRGAVAAESSRQHAQGAHSKAGAPYPARSTGPKEPNHRAHPPPARSQATYQDLPHIEFSHSAALDARVTPARHAIKRKSPDIAEAESKHQRRVDEEQHFAGLSTMVEGQQRFILHFIIGRDGGEKFFARGFDNVKTSSRADNATFIRHPETGKYHPLPSGTTPILATQNDRGIYASEIRKWSLYNSQ